MGERRDCPEQLIPEPLPSLPDLLRRAAAELEDGERARAQLRAAQEEAWALRGRVHELEDQTAELTAELERVRGGLRALLGGQP